MTLVEQLLSLYPELTQKDFIRNIVIQDNNDGNGPFIAAWNSKLPQPTEEELSAARPPPPDIQALVVEAVQGRLDAFAQTRSYDHIMSACTYSNSKIPKFRQEGQYCVDVRDDSWATCYQILDDVLTGRRPIPTVDEALSELPELVWPT